MQALHLLIKSFEYLVSLNHMYNQIVLRKFKFSNAVSA